MIETAVIGFIFLFIGVALGRIKNQAKLNALKEDLVKLEASASAEIQKLAAFIRAKL